MGFGLNWQAIGAVGELIGAVAVVATLIYLSIQLRQNTRQMENHVKTVDLTSFNAIDESFSRFRTMLATHAEVADLWRRTKEDYLSLPEDEIERADALAWEWLVICQNMHHRISQIVQADSIFSRGSSAEYMEFVMRRELSYPGLRQWWLANNAERFFPAFQEIGNRVFAEYDEKGPDA